MQYILTNAVAILAAAICGFLVTVGYVVTVRRAEPAGAPGGALLAALAFVAQAWLACILAGALILAPPQAGAWTMALGSAVVIWTGFVLPSLFVTLRFRGVRAASAARDAAVWLVVMLMQAGVLHLVGVSRSG